MAVEEDIIFRFEVDQQEAIRETVELQKEIDRLVKKQNELDKSTEEGAIAYAENAASIRALKKEQSDLNKVIDASIVTRNKEIQSIDQARANVKILTKERNGLNISTAEGKARLQQLNAELDKNNAFIKDNVDAYTKQKIGIGDYKTAILEAAGDLKLFGVSLNEAKKGLELTKKGIDITKSGFGSFDQVLKSSAIGLVLVALTGLIALFTRFEPMMDAVKQGTAAFNAALDVLVQRLIKVGKGALEVVIGYFEGLLQMWKAIGQFITGDFDAAVDTAAHSFDRLAAGAKDVGSAFDGMGTEMKNAATAAWELEGALQALEDRQTAQIILNAKAEQSISKLLLMSKNRTLSEKARMGLLKEAGAIEQLNFEQNKSIAEEQYRIALEQAQLKTDLSQREIEELMTNTERREKLEERIGTLTGDEIKALAEKKAEIIRLETESVGVQEKIQNRLDVFMKEIEENRAKEREKRRAEEKQHWEDYNKFIEDFVSESAANLKKLTDEADKALSDFYKKREIERTDQLTKGLITQEQFDAQALTMREQQLEAQRELDIRFGRDTVDTDLEITKNRLAIKKQQEADEKTINDARLKSEQDTLAGLQNITTSAAQLFGEQTAAGKASAIAGTTISTYSSATKAFDSLAGIPIIGPALGTIAAGLAIAAGLKNVAKIAGVDVGGAAAGGGTFRTKGPTYMLLGDNPGGVEEITVKPISGRGQTIVNPKSNLMQMGAGGTVYADGGAAVSKMTGNVNKAFDVKEMVEALPAPVLKLSDLDKAQVDQAKVVRVATLG